MLSLVALFLLAHGAEYGPSAEGEILAAEAPVEDTGGPVGCSDLFLQDGVQLPDLPGFYHRLTPDNAWGTTELVDLIVETSRHMQWLMPDASQIVVGDLSYRHGGQMYGHKSHRGGVDADIGVYWKHRWQPGNQFPQFPASELDVEATWAMLSAMLDTGRVDMILLDRSLIARLRTYTLENGLLSPDEADRIFNVEGGRSGWEYTGVIRHVQGHHDHMHVRVLCSDGAKPRG